MLTTHSVATPAVTGHLTDMPTRGLDDLRTGQLFVLKMDVKLQPTNQLTGQLADAAGDFACLVFVFLATY